MIQTGMHVASAFRFFCKATAIIESPPEAGFLYTKYAKRLPVAGFLYGKILQRRVEHPPADRKE